MVEFRPIDRQYLQGEYVVFRDDGLPNPKAKTRRFRVISRHSGALLGFIEWHVPWRQYTMKPLNSVLDKHSLREIADFAEQQTTVHKQQKQVVMNEDRERKKAREQAARQLRMDRARERRERQEQLKELQEIGAAIPKVVNPQPVTPPSDSFLTDFFG